MRWFKDTSIRRKLTRVILLTTGSALSIAGISFLGYDHFAFRRQMTRDLTTLATITGLNSTAALIFNDPKAAQEILASLSAKPHVITACVYDRSGNVFARYQRPGAPTTSPLPAPEPDGSRFARGRLMLFHRIVLENESIGTIYIEMDLRETTARLLPYAGIVGVVLLASFLAAFLLSSRLQNVISGPILNLAQTAFAVSVEQDYSVRASKESQDELGFLVDRFNDMLVQIQVRNEELRRHREHLQEEVSARTTDLTTVNAELAAAKERAEQAQSETELLLHSTAEAIYAIDLQGNCTMCNPACLRMLGYKDSSVLLGKDMHALIHHSRPDGTPYSVGECPIFRAFRTDSEAHVDDEVFWRADGSSVPVEYWSYPVRRDGEIVGAVVTSLDITERRQNEAQVREINQALAALFETSPVAIITLDRDGKVQMWNPAAERMFGWSEAEVKGQSLPYLPPGLEREAKDSLANILRGESFANWEVTRRRKDGSPIEASISAAPLRDARGRIRGAMGVIVDVTERKRVEADLHRAKEAAEAASHAKSEFLANMSHEIRTPLNGILGMTELVLDSALTKEQREYLTMAKDSAESLLTVINDILDFSKIEAGKLDFAQVEFDVREALSDAIKPLALRAEQKGVELVYHPQPDVPARLVGDPSRLRQIIVNLVGNAIKFTEQGEIVLRVETETQNDEEACLHFSVADTGIGIAAEKHEAIFRAFEQADSSTTRKYSGTGLGLTVSSRLVALMRGRMWLESELGKGSTFHFNARFGIAKGETTSPAPAQPTALEAMPVLAVDDNETNRRLLEDVLRSWHMRPHTVSSGRAGLAAMLEAQKRGCPFPLVLLDAHMPEMDGFELTERIRQQPELSRATVMMLSSGGQRGDAARCRELGIEAYLTKPVRQSELLDAILTALGRRIAETPEAAPLPLVTRHSLREAGRRLRILLAEDNEVNQRLAVRLLEKRGHQVTVADNGRQALAELEAQHFDLVLMDVQMPEMDGFAATAAIRAREQATGGHLTIVALTAHAMKGDRERCLAAGMDDYLTKPIRSQELDELLDRNLPGKLAQLLTQPITARASVQTAPLNSGEILARLEGDREFLGELTDIFLADCPRLLEKARTALEQGDCVSLTLTAHKLKGALGNFSAGPAVAAAGELESFARAGNLKGAADALRTLREEVARLEPALAAMRREETS